MALTISLFSNFFNEHQEPVSSFVASQDDVSFTFVSLEATEGVVGRASLDDEYPYVLRAYEHGENSMHAMVHAVEDDVVIFGDMAGREGYVRARAQAGGPFLRYTERILKRGDWWSFVPPKRWRTWSRFGRYEDYPMCVLCASAFASLDLARFGFPVEKCLKWGYFPHVPSSAAVSGWDDRHPVRLCSAQRFVSWKRVDLQIEAAALLKERGLDFTFDIAGDGECYEVLRRLVVDKGLEGYVRFLGVLSHDDTLALMHGSDVFLATSDRNEGWGATVNEAMNAGCTVVASNLVGSAPYLLRNGKDGMVFESGNATELADSLETLIANADTRRSLALSAQKRVSGLWSAQVAALRLVELSRRLMAGEDVPLFEDGPLSPATVTPEDWYR